MNAFRIVKTNEVVPFVSASLSQTLDSWLWDFSAEIATEVDLEKLTPAKDLRTDYVEVSFKLGTETWALIIDVPSSNDTEFQYSVTGYSKTALLGAKFADQINKTWSNVNAKAIVQELCDAAGITLSWQVPDWPVRELTATDNYPIDVISKLVGNEELKAKILAMPDGSLAVVKGCVDPKTLQSLTPDCLLSTDRNIFQRGSTYINNGNYNQVTVVNATDRTASASISLDQEDSGTDKLVKVFVSPFSSDIELEHTSGNNVKVFYDGVKTETNNETVFIEDGKGRLTKGFDELNSLQWEQNESGSLTINGNGDIECSSNQFGLVNIDYTTQYHQYRFQKSADIDFTGVKASTTGNQQLAGDSVTLMFDDGSGVKDAVIVRTLSTEETMLFRAEAELYRQVYDADKIRIGDCVYDGSPMLCGQIAQVNIKRSGDIVNALVLSVSLDIDDDSVSQSVELENYRV